MYKTLTEAILNTGNPGPDNKGVLYYPWKGRYSKTIADFYNDFVEERLPDIEVVIKWHKLLVKYASRKDAIFPIRAGNSSKKLRRGWLVRVDDGFSYMFSDNDLAVYIYKMALDGFCPDEEEFYKFMTEFVEPNRIEWLASINQNPRKKGNASINNAVDELTQKKRCFLRMPVHFNRIGGKGADKTEDEKNAYINTEPAPSCCLGKYNYKHAHLVGVGDAAYEILVHGKKEEIYFENIKTILLGEDADYKWDDTIANYSWNRKLSDYSESIDFSIVEKIIKAQYFRFLDPLNHFLAPMAEQNKFTKYGGYPSMDIAEYDNLLRYIIARKRQVFGFYFTEFMNISFSSEELFVDNSDIIGQENIDVVYHEKSLSMQLYGNKVGKTVSHKVAIDLTKISKAELENYNPGVIAFQVLGAILNSGKVSESDIAKFKSAADTKAIFGFGKPLLSTEIIKGKDESSKCYVKPFILYGETLYMYSQWTQNHKKRLIEWIVQWIDSNGGKI